MRIWKTQKARTSTFILFAPNVRQCDSRPVVPGWAGWAMAHPDFGGSVNPISTRGNRLCPPNSYWHTRIFRPSNGPAQYPSVSLRILKQLCITKRAKKFITKRGKNTTTTTTQIWVSRSSATSGKLTGELKNVLTFHCLNKLF